MSRGDGGRDGRSDGGRGGGGGAADRSRPPDAGPIRPFSFPAVESVETESATDLRVARISRFPVATLRAILPAGEDTVGADRAGVAVLAGDALEEGTERRDGAALASALEEIGASLSIGTSWDATTLSVTCLADRLPRAAELLGEVIRRPSFPEGELERLRNQRLAAIHQRRMSPSALAADEMERLLFRPDVPYARPLAGTEESVRELDREAVRVFAGLRHRVTGGGVVAAGDLEPAEVRALVEEHLGQDPGGPSPRPADFVPEVRSRERRVVVVDRPGSVQSEIRVAQLGQPRSTPDYFPLLVMNTILGGSFTSRLNLSLRERHGFTYGVRSRFHFRRKAGPFSVGTAVGTEVTGSAVGEILAEVGGLLEGGPDAEEVEAARDYIAGVFPLQLETVEQVAARVGELIVHGLPDDYHDRYRDRVRAVEPEQVAEAARRHVRPSEFLVLVVGDAERVSPDLEELELGPLEVVQPIGAPIVSE